MVDLPHPPWAIAADETVASGGAEFGRCDEVVALLVERMSAELGLKSYTTSRRWGLVVRATLALPTGGSSEPRVTCWGRPGGKVNIVVDFFGLDSPLE